MSDFIRAFNELAQDINRTAIEKGWWDRPKWVQEACELLPPELVDKVMEATDRNDGEILALIHSEVSECLEGLRHQNPPDDKLPQFNSVEVELADVIIRIMDYAKVRGFRVAEAVVAKAEYNTSRAYKHGGKKF